MLSARRTWLTIAIAAALLAAMSVPVSAAQRTDGSSVSRSTGRIVVDARARTYTLLRPIGTPAGARLALVVLLHGGYGDGAGAITQGNWEGAAARAGFMVVAPDGVGRAWNAGGCCGTPQARGVDDVKFVRTLVGDLSRRYRIDAARVYATGMSNGAMMSYRLACEAADVFAGVAPVAGTLFTTCRPSRPVSLLHIHGLADQNVPFEGGVGPKAAQRNPPSYPPVRSGVLAWATTDGCGTSTTTTARLVTTERWATCRAPTAVELITIADGGHSWPGGQRLSVILDPPSQALDATSVIWSFFAAHPRP